MAVVGVLEDKGSGLRKRKRGRMRMKKKLDVNDKVEVRTGEQGFQGSWHQGTIISWDNQGCHVKYDNLLVDDGSDNLVEIVDASPLADGIDCRCGSQCNYRGSLRPLPPKLEFNKWNLCYGLCVDVYYTEAWWEGVIYDHEDGSEKRRVFFPDLGDEMLAEIRNLRITQDWNDFEEEWHQRGTWLFLEVIEEYEKEWYIPVSVKQLWYDLREKKGFQKKVKEWTSSCAALWKELVLEVIKDNQEITVDHFLRVSGLPGSSQPAIPVADVNMSHDTDLANTNTFGLEPAVPVADVDTSSDAGLADTLPLVIVDDPINNTMKSSNSASIQLYQDKYDTGQLGHILNDDNNFLTEFNGSSPDKAVCVVPEALLVSPSVADRISCISSVTSTEGSPGTDSDMAKTRARSSKLNATATWMTAGKDIVPKAEACPDAITKYALAGKKNNNALIIDARKHLLYQGWKIECKRDNIFRVRYISPGGDCYYSLYKLCLEFMEPSEKLISSNTTDLQVVEANNQDVHLVDLNTKDAHVVKPKTRDLHVVEPKTQELQVVEPEYCPQAVLDWSKADQKTYSCPSTRKDMILKAKKHLSWLGWTFRFANCNGRRYLCYVSPRGRAHGSLRKACQGCLKEEITETDNSPSGHVENMNVVKEDDSLLLSEELSSAHSNMAVQRTSVPSNAKSENWSGGCYTLGMRDLVELSSVGQETRKHKRKRKDSSLCLASLLGKRRANLPVENTSISACGKTPAALIKLREDLKGRQLNCVLRSTKRVQQVVTPSPLHKNPRTVLSWLIDNNVVLPRSKVHYGRKEQKSKFEGRITRDGIKCSCCEKVYTLGGFVVHAGGTNHKSAGNIFLEDGRSLLDCQLEMLHNNKMTKLEKNRKCRLKGNGRKDKNDCICSVCHYGGELILCDHCPSSFHKSCLGIKTVPDGDWFCPSCCCGICGQSEAKEDGANVYERSLISCAQCEHKYHAMCICSRGTYRWDLCAKANWFCSKKCEEIFLGLHELLGRPIPVGTDNLTWTLIKSMKSDTHDLDASDNEAVIENYSKLSIALDVMHECFEPVKETRTGRDLVADIIFSRSSELNRLNFQGFYTILLERNDELITAANVRVHGEKVAEVPLIGTRFQYRRLGMCRILMNELEKKLKEFGVQRLILPAVPSVLRTWTTSFGFSKMMPLERLNFVKYTFLDFQGAIMCQKLLLEGPLVEPKLLIGSQVELHNDAFHSSDKVDVDGASAVSEVFQAGQIEENGFMDQGLLEIDAGGQIDSNKTSVPIVDALQENQPTQVDHEPHDSEANSKCSVEDTNRKEKECGANRFLKFYTRRRKMSANGG